MFAKVGDQLLDDDVEPRPVPLAEALIEPEAASGGYRVAEGGWPGNVYP